MRIAHIANFYSPTSGGLRTAMHALGRGYVERGHEVLMVVPGVADSTVPTRSGLRTTIASPALPGSGGYRMITRLAAVRAALEDFAPDVIEVSDRTTLRSLGKWAEQRGIPSVFIAHERADGVLAAHLPRWSHRLLPLGSLADNHNRAMVRRFTTIVATTDFAGEEFARIPYPVTTIPLGVDLEAFHPGLRDGATRAHYAHPDEALVVMASRLSAEKRPDLAINAIRVLTERGRRVRLVCAGSGALEGHMRALADELPVTFAGFVEGRERFARLLASADAVIAPGPVETFGLAALEALAAGTPVVVNRDSALPQVMGDAGMAADGTPEAFADALETTLDADPVEARACARRRAEHLPWNTTVESMLTLHARSLGLVTAELPLIVRRRERARLVH
ncbi:glycosyltransferase [Demequina sp.]|uniref:glycosyltransferase n=1 Tax=Demequina sp. TaxID=2050685 RepID=UPI003A86E8E6